jgi:N-acetyl sugar amidotransferase
MTMILPGGAEAKTATVPPAPSRCSRCIMDTTDPDISFDADGVCNHCRSFDAERARLPQGAEARQALDALVARIKAAGRGREYDCMIGLSGGVDSTFVALKVKQLGLRPLALHFDSGWNAEVAVSNIGKVVRKLDLDLHTYVVNWEEMRDLQLAFLRASVANADIPTDHGFIAVMYQLAAKHGIRYILTGHNVATEWVLPVAWGYSPRDLRHLRGVHRRFGTRPLKTFPQLGLFYDVVYCRLIRRIRMIRLIDYFPYVRREAMAEIEREFGWRYYGGKHLETVFSRFYQSYYLPKRFGYDKRLAHLSSLIVSGQMTRDEALEEMKIDPAPPEQARADTAYVAKKLGVSVAEMEAIIASPTRTYRDFPSNERLVNALFAARRFVRGY